MNKDFDIIVVGAGPSGLMAAIEASKHSKVLVLEKMKKVGLKLLSTGGGRCNLTNVLSVKELVDKFQTKAVYPALSNFDTKSVLKFFNECGVTTCNNDGFHYFPKSQKAVEVLQALLTKCSSVGVEIISECIVEQLLTDNNDVVGLRTSKGVFNAKKIVVATGGQSYKQFGSTGDGYRIASNSGHTVTELNPMLGGIHIKNSFKTQLAGIVLKDVKLTVKHPVTKNSVVSHGDLLITHKGISGPVCLDISGVIASMLKIKQPLDSYVDLLPQFSREEFTKIMNGYRDSDAKKQIKSCLQTYFVKSVIDMLIEVAGIENKKIAEISKKEMTILVTTIKEHHIIINGTDGYDKSMTTMGGVDLNDVNMKTLESKKVKGLYFVGEVLDVNGPCGGYNLTWAFSSGVLAGKSCKL